MNLNQSSNMQLSDGKTGGPSSEFLNVDLPTEHDIGPTKNANFTKDIDKGSSNLMGNSSIQIPSNRPFTSKLRNLAAFKLKRKLNSHSQSIAKDITGLNNNNGTIDLYIEATKAIKNKHQQQL